ncbi:trans-Golgi network integral membrane protein 2-like [Ornithodoros turicata]|uniref:trans-Golgi network integral membrane protein 2-like n=1 Tax=Ornithodoros turicata TaxID=34597 RepID=UPI003138F6A7
MRSFYVLPQQLMLKMCKLKYIIVVFALHLVLSSVDGVPAPQSQPNRSRTESLPASVAQESVVHSSSNKTATKTLLNTSSGRNSFPKPGIQQNVGDASHYVKTVIPTRTELRDRAPQNSKIIDVPHAGDVPLLAPKQAKQSQVVAAVSKNSLVGNSKPYVNELHPKRMSPQTKEQAPLASKNAQLTKTTTPSVLATSGTTDVSEPTQTESELEADRPEYAGETEKSPAKKADVNAKKKASPSQKTPEPTVWSKAAESSPRPLQSVAKAKQSAQDNALVKGVSSVMPPKLGVSQQASLSDQENLTSLGLMPYDGRQSDKIETSKPKNSIYLNGGDVADFTSQQSQWLEPTRAEWKKPLETVDMSPVVTEEDSHFFAYFLAATVLCILAYLAFHNKRKIMALAIEGRGGRQRRHTTAYRRLENMDKEGRPIF